MKSPQLAVGLHSDMGKCKFRGCESPLQQSHVVPEFFYEYDDKHRILSVHGKYERPLPKQKGDRYPILCFDCEQHFNDTFEKPMRRMWIEERSLQVHPSADVIVINVSSYSKFKLFHLSVLWRALVAGYDEETAETRRHAARLHEMLLDQRPGAPTEYPLVAFALVHRAKGEPLGGTVMLPHPSTIRDQTVYSAVFGGCHWLYVLSEAGIPVPAVQEWALNADGRIIAEVRDLREVPEIDGLLAKYEQNAKEKNWRDPWRPKRGG